MWITALAGTALAAFALALPASAQQPERPSARAPEVRVIERDGFHWGDAAIGALAGVGLAAVCTGLFLATGWKKRSM